MSISWHTSSVGVPGYSWYCPPGSRALREATVLWMVSYYRHIATCKAKGFIPVYRLGEDGNLLKEVGDMLSVWALRARS